MGPLSPPWRELIQEGLVDRACQILGDKEGRRFILDALVVLPFQTVAPDFGGTVPYGRRP